MDLKFNSSRKYISISVPSKSQAMSPHIKSVDDIIVLGMNLSKFNKPTQFFICVSGVFMFYLIYGYLQELIFSVEGFKPFGWYLTLVQFGFYSIFGLIELQLIQDKRRRIPGKTYMIIAFLTVGTMGLSNTSLGYLNYPTQVIFKCCKLIPVMIGGVFIQGKRYNIADVSAAMCMSLGLIWFTLADSTIAPNFNLTGVVLISLALCADAVIGNVQEKAMKLHNGSNSEMVLYSYSIGFVYILLGLTCSSGLSPAVTFCSKHPVQTYGYAFFFSLTGYFGVNGFLSDLLQPLMQRFNLWLETKNGRGESQRNFSGIFEQVKPGYWNLNCNVLCLTIIWWLVLLIYWILYLCLNFSICKM
ncbi:adenosine 3'-phospho 5'-phosphosulfate transporter 2 isoform X2 [Caretta caretta]|uniref:adenosine 3'-phospho 5'-phosphosulfate transporter 2 isoform X2 n=1 Tax=Caretta caretta TaxID=8467 RepID=UPI0020948C77|nr:adenosine 3'-phospho 5'-phosphosulfate transporter 2 isoform X2 [Caretta caretta]